MSGGGGAVVDVDELMYSDNPETEATPLLVPFMDLTDQTYVW